MAGPFYARYVPPRAPVIAATPVKPQTLLEAQEAAPPAAAAAAADATTLEKKERKKKKKEKAPKKRKRPENDEAAEEDDETQVKKHKGVLSKFQKSVRLAEVERAEEKQAETEPREEPELHDLVPLPQPEPVPEAPYEPTFSSLPSWLTEPVTAPATARIPFDSLNIDAKLVRHLNSKGYNDAFAVQSAVLPLLLPGAPASVADVCVSAATGSGKTLAYLLPMIESMRHRAVTKLRGVIVVPTRELVTQVRESAELCAAGSGVKIGTAMGNHAFPVEQDLLIKKGRRYDPAGAKFLHDKANDSIVNGWATHDQQFDDILETLPGHVPVYESKVDILICTPGRLVEHLQQSKGFHLEDVEWLVIDEADRLLDQSFQGWAENVMKALEAEKSPENSTPGERIISKLSYPPQKRYVRKIILSATMTRDLSKLSALKLRRPTLVVTEGTEGVEGAKHEGEVFDLPPTLEECAIQVGDGSQKPLYLLNLLQSRIMPYFQDSKTDQEKMDVDDNASNADSSSSSDSDSDTDMSSDTSDDDDDDSSSSSSDSSESSSESGPNSSKMAIDGQAQAGATAPQKDTAAETAQQEPTENVLIFTHNNENANRLSRLLSLLHPAYARTIGTLTKSASTSTSRKVLRHFRAGKLRILIASDRASRGLDVPRLAHIVSYDVPSSVPSYVHRAGRTARAGAHGVAWTLVTKNEAGWFFNVIAKGEALRRGERKVERLRLDGALAEERVKAYEEALEKLKEEVRGKDE